MSNIDYNVAFATKMKHYSNNDLAPTLESTSSAEVIQYFADLLGGDSLAAEYLLYCILSQVFVVQLDQTFFQPFTIIFWRHRRLSGQQTVGRLVLNLNGLNPQSSLKWGEGGYKLYKKSK